MRTLSLLLTPHWMDDFVITVFHYLISLVLVVRTIYFELHKGNRTERLWERSSETETGRHTQRERGWVIWSNEQEENCTFKCDNVWVNHKWKACDVDGDHNEWTNCRCDSECTECSHIAQQNDSFRRATVSKESEREKNCFKIVDLHSCIQRDQHTKPYQRPLFQLTWFYFCMCNNQCFVLSFVSVEMTMSHQ